MLMSRAESQRVHHEFEKFYWKYPKLKMQANHQIFLQAAEAAGGSEVLTAEWLELQLDSLRGQLGVMRETPQEALDNFMQANPGFECGANRALILQRVQRTNESVHQAAVALGNQLAFNQEVADEIKAQSEAQERPGLIEEIVLDHSLVRATQDNYRRRLQAANLSIESLRQTAQEIRDRQAFRKMSKEDLRKILRDANPPQADTLPEKYSREHLIFLANTDLEAFKNVCKRWGQTLVNARLAEV